MCQHAGMSQDAVEVQCQRCLKISSFSSRGDNRCDCPCGYSYNLRRCSSCGVVSNVHSLQQRHEPWACIWCKAANQGYTPRNDPATATLGDLAADMASHGLEFASSQPRQQPRDTQPVLIVTTNDVPGYRITQVHGDVFGLIVRARNYFSNMGAQLRTLAGGEVAGYTRLLTGRAEAGSGADNVANPVLACPHGICEYLQCCWLLERPCRDHKVLQKLFANPPLVMWLGYIMICELVEHGGA